MFEKEHRLEQELLEQDLPPASNGGRSPRVAPTATSTDKERHLVSRFKHVRTESIDGTEMDQILLDEERERIDAQVHSLGFDDQQMYFARLLGLDSSDERAISRMHHRQSRRRRLNVC